MKSVFNIADDILVYGVGNTGEEANANHNRNLEAVLKRCHERNNVLNRDKLKLQWKVSFMAMGHVFTGNGVKMGPYRAKAVQEMAKPEYVEDIQRLNGFVSNIAKYATQVKKVSELRNCKKENPLHMPVEL